MQQSCLIASPRRRFNITAAAAAAAAGEYCSIGGYCASYGCLQRSTVVYIVTAVVRMSVYNGLQ